MRHPLGSVWLAVIGGMLGWSLRILPPLPSQAGPTLAAVDEPALPPAHRFRAQPATLGLDLHGKRAERGLSVYLLASQGPDASACVKWLVIESNPPFADLRAAAGALPYFPTGPPPTA
jgi:hypothetical protein